MKEVLLLSHPTLGVLGIIAAAWVIAETLNASDANQGRIKRASVLVAVLMGLTWVSAGFFYVLYYPADKAIILAGPWPFAHNFFMESKEHAFFITLVLAFFLPIAARGKDLVTNRQTRAIVISTAALIVLSGLALEGAGAIMALAVKVGLLQGIIH